MTSDVAKSITLKWIELVELILDIDEVKDNV